MRHQKSGVKLGRTSSHRKAMFRNMVTSLFKYDRIHTTDTKAKALRGWADHLIGLAKRGDLHARRQALSIMREKTVVHKLFAEAAQKFEGIQGGYTRTVKLAPRPGDCAPMVVIELYTRDKRGGKKEARPQKPAVSSEVKPMVEKADSPAAAEPAALKAPETEPVKETTPVAAAEASPAVDAGASADSQVPLETKPGDLAQKPDEQR